MKQNLNKMFVVLVVLSSIFMAGSLVACVCSAIFVLAQGNIVVGTAMVICFALLFLISAFVLGMCISWKRSSTMITKYDNGKPNFYEQKTIDEKNDL